MFESVTRVAIDEILTKHMESSRFGFVLTPEGREGLTTELYELLATSRSLKSAGDRFLSGQGQPAARGSRASVRQGP